MTPIRGPKSNPAGTVSFAAAPARATSVSPRCTLRRWPPIPTSSARSATGRPPNAGTHKISAAYSGSRCMLKHRRLRTHRHRARHVDQVDCRRRASHQPGQCVHGHRDDTDAGMKRFPHGTGQLDSVGPWDGFAAGDLHAASDGSPRSSQAPARSPTRPPRGRAPTPSPPPTARLPAPSTRRAPAPTTSPSPSVDEHVVSCVPASVAINQGSLHRDRERHRCGLEVRSRRARSA